MSTTQRSDTGAEYQLISGCRLVHAVSCPFGAFAAGETVHLLRTVHNGAEFLSAVTIDAWCPVGWNEVDWDYDPKCSH